MLGSVRAIVRVTCCQVITAGALVLALASGAASAPAQSLGAGGPAATGTGLARVEAAAAPRPSSGQAPVEAFSGPVPDETLRPLAAVRRERVRGLFERHQRLRLLLARPVTRDAGLSDRRSADLGKPGGAEGSGSSTGSTIARESLDVDDENDDALMSEAGGRLAFRSAEVRLPRPAGSQPPGRGPPAPRPAEAIGRVIDHPPTPALPCRAPSSVRRSLAIDLRFFRPGSIGMPTVLEAPRPPVPSARPASVHGPARPRIPFVTLDPDRAAGPRDDVSTLEVPRA